MHIRPATPRDFEFLDRLYKEKDCAVEFNHIDSAQIIEDEDGKPVAIGVMNRLIEATFLVEKGLSKRKRIEALMILMHRADNVAKKMMFTSFHAFSTSPEMTKLLIRKFKFVKTVSDVLVKWVV